MPRTRNPSICLTVTLTVGKEFDYQDLGHLLDILYDSFDLQAKDELGEVIDLDGLEITDVWDPITEELIFGG